MSVCAGDAAEIVMSGWRLERRFDPEDPELMDRPQPVSAALEKDLENLRGLNRWFGAWRIIRHWLGPRLERGRALRIVDLCTGSGDLPILMVEMARAAGCRLVVDAVDAHPATLEIARRHCEAWPEIRLHAGDARTWEGEERPDYVVCSLALHHFTEADAGVILGRMREMGGRGMMVADLERAWWAVAGVWAASCFYREPMTVEDARRSAVAAFSRGEMLGMLRGAGWDGLKGGRFFYGRQAWWVDK